MNRFRSAVVLMGWFIFMVFAIYFNTAAPQPIKVKELTEQEIKDGVKRDRIEKMVGRASAAARGVYRRNGCSDRYSDLTGRTAYEFGISSRLLAAVVFVESSCKSGAVSGKDSIGLLQVNPRIWGHRKDLTNPEKNLKIGASILKSYITRFGLVEGLHHYNGYSEVHGHEYVNKILAASR